MRNFSIFIDKIIFKVIVSNFVAILSRAVNCTLQMCPGWTTGMILSNPWYIRMVLFHFVLLWSYYESIMNWQIVPIHILQGVCHEIYCTCRAMQFRKFWWYLYMFFQGWIFLVDKLRQISLSIIYVLKHSLTKISNSWYHWNILLNAHSFFFGYGDISMENL